MILVFSGTAAALAAQWQTSRSDFLAFGALPSERVVDAVMPQLDLDRTTLGAGVQTEAGFTGFAGGLAAHIPLPPAWQLSAGVRGSLAPLQRRYSLVSGANEGEFRSGWIGAFAGVGWQFIEGWTLLGALDYRFSILGGFTTQSLGLAVGLRWRPNDLFWLEARVLDAGAGEFWTRQGRLVWRPPVAEISGGVDLLRGQLRIEGRASYRIDGSHLAVDAGVRYRPLPWLEFVAGGGVEFYPQIDFVVQAGIGFRLGDVSWHGGGGFRILQGDVGTAVHVELGESTEPDIDRTLFEEAARLLAEGDTEGARRSLSGYEAQQPADPAVEPMKVLITQIEQGLASPTSEVTVDALIEEGDELVADDRNLEAAGVYREAYLMEPERDDVQNRYESALRKSQMESRTLARQAEAAAVDGDLTAAESAISIIARADPGNPVLARLNEILQQREELAIPEDQSFDDNASRVRRLIILAERSLISLNLDAAKNYAQGALDVEPTNLEAMRLLASIREEERRLAGIDARRQRANALVAEAEQLFEADFIENAIARLRDAISVDPGNPKAAQLLTLYQATLDEYLASQIAQARQDIAAGRVNNGLQELESIQSDFAGSEVAEAASNALAEAEDDVEDEIAVRLVEAERAESSGELEEALEAYNDVLEVRPAERQAIEGRDRVLTALSAYLEVLVDEGRTAYEAGDLDRAVNVLETVLELDQNNRQAQEILEIARLQLDEEIRSRSLEDFLQLARMYLENREYTDAITNYEYALTRAPGNQEALSGIVEAERERNELERLDFIRAVWENGVSAWQNGDFLTAGRRLRSGMERMRPSDSFLRNEFQELLSRVSVEEGLVQDELITAARDAEAGGDLAGARLYLDRAISIDSERAEVNAERRRLTQAIEDAIRRSLEQGQTTFSSGSYDSAGDAFAIVSLLDPDSQRGKYAVTMQQRAERARGLWESIREEGGTEQDIEQLSSLDELLRINREDEDAQDLFDQLRAELAREADVLRDEANRFYAQGELELAILRYEIVLAADPNDVVSREYLQRAQRRLQDQLVRLFENGRLALSSRNYAEAVRLFQRLQGIDPNFRNVTDLLAQAQQGYEDEAERMAAEQSRLEEQRRAMARTRIQQAPAAEPAPRPSTSSRPRPAATPSTPTQATPSRGDTETANRLFYEGLALYQRNEFEQAISIWQRALNADPSLARAREYIVRAQYKLRRG